MFIKIILNKFYFFLFKLKEKIIFNNGISMSKQFDSYLKINDFSEVEFSSFSQNGEDGIIDWLVTTLGINKRMNCIEIGCGNYLESNTRFLVKKRNWPALLIDSDKNNIDLIKSDSIYWRNTIVAVNDYVQMDNVNEIIKSNNFINNVGLLSIDIDSIDYWVLSKIEFKPIIIICEYNAIFGDKLKLTVPYDQKFNRNKKHYSNLYFGASINAFIDLLKQKNYSFLGTDSRGINAFFVLKDYSLQIEEKIKYKRVFKSTHREALNQEGKLSYINFNEQLSLIHNLNLLDLQNNKTIGIQKIQNNVYSENYMRNSYNDF